MRLTSGDFAEFFGQVNRACEARCPEGCTVHRAPVPFAWQSGYLAEVAAGGDWRDLDIPTGLGKTSLIDIWLFLLALQHTAGAARTVPLRLFFVVDRRLVVDQAHEHGRRLAERLASAPAGSVTARVAEALRDLGGAEPLEVVRMRGGVDWASRWLDSPARPALVTATVDQYGSRLLFRGYGVSSTMRPIDAALCGIDALLAIDEAHISRPLLETALSCAAYQRTAESSALEGREVKVVSLSATAPSGSGRTPFVLPPEDEQNEHAAPRLNAQRRVTLWDASGLARKREAAFAAAADQALDPLLKAVELPLVGVVANTIGSARAAHARLAARQDVDTILLTGRCRPAERELILDSAEISEITRGVTGSRRRPLVLVATQTIEVGWDISFGGMITEFPSLDALVQRLGRVNRTGGLTHAPILVVRPQKPKNAAEEERIPVYGTAAARTWDWLTTQTPPLDKNADLSAALSPETGLLLNPPALRRLLTDVDRTPLSAPAPDIPVVHATLLASWARTDPAPVPDQSPAPFLHGLDTTEPDVQVLWRVELEAEGDGGQPQAPMPKPAPHAGELVAVPAAQLRHLIAAAGEPDDLADLEGQPDSPATQRHGQLTASVLRWHPEDSSDGEPVDPWRPITSTREIQPGGIYMLPSALGGHDAYGFTRAADALDVPDLGDHRRRTTRAVTRIDADVLASTAGIGAAGRSALRSAISTAGTKLTGDSATEPTEDPTTIIADLLGALTAICANETAAEERDPRGPARFADLVTERLTELAEVEKWAEASRRMHRAEKHRTGRYTVHSTGLILTPPASSGGSPLPGVSDDTDTTSTPVVTLAAHSRAVARRAHQFATRLALPQELRAAVQLAAHAHDVGKSHPRFQQLLCGGDSLRAEALAEPLAKSGMDPTDRAAFRQASKLARWHRHHRHEALSAAAVHGWLATSPPAADDADHDLITHLTAAHHGHARPLLPPDPDPEPTPVTCTMPDGQDITIDSAAMGTDWDGHDRFHTLNQRYGPWAVALLETLVRLADMACSEEGT